MTGDTPGPRLVVLGTAQDGGIPQTGAHDHPAYADASLRRRVACLAIVHDEPRLRAIVDATPDFREQLFLMETIAAGPHPPGALDDETPLTGLFLTHAHVGHYAGLVHLGAEAMNARRVPTYVMPRMRAFLERNAPWEALVRGGHVALHALAPGRAVELGAGVRVTPVPVPHREDYTETVGFRIDGDRRRVLYVPDIDGWKALDATGERIEAMLARVDVAYLDGSFFDDEELPQRDRAEIAHPTILESLERFATLPAEERAKIRFTHLNHTNPVLVPGSAARRRVERAGMRVAEDGETLSL